MSYLNDNIETLAAAWMEPEYWVRIVINFIQKNSSMKHIDIADAIHELIRKSPITLHEIFEIFLKLKELNNKMSFDLFDFNTILYLSQRGMKANNIKKSLYATIEGLKIANEK